MRLISQSKDYTQPQQKKLVNSHFKSILSKINTTNLISTSPNFQQKHVADAWNVEIKFKIPGIHLFVVRERKSKPIIGLIWLFNFSFSEFHKWNYIVIPISGSHGIYSYLPFFEILYSFFFVLDFPRFFTFIFIPNRLKSLLGNWWRLHGFRSQVERLLILTDIPCLGMFVNLRPLSLHVYL